MAKVNGDSYQLICIIGQPRVFHPQPPHHPVGSGQVLGTQCLIMIYFHHGKISKSYTVLKRRTFRKKLRAALANFKQWMKENHSLPTPALFAKLNRKPRGYWQYYGIRGNFKSLGDCFYLFKKILMKKLNRRSHRKSYTLEGFRALFFDFKLAKPRICHDF